MPITQAVASTDRLLGSRPNTPSFVGASLLAKALYQAYKCWLMQLYREQARSYKLCAKSFIAC
jgi:hypothetical protein